MEVSRSKTDGAIRWLSFHHAELRRRFYSSTLFSFLGRARHRQREARAAIVMVALSAPLYMNTTI